MFRKELSKASEEWLWNDADQNDSFSDSSYLFPIQRIIQNEAMIARTETNSIHDLGQINEGYLLLTGSNSGKFLDRTIDLRDDATIDWLIKWVQLAAAFDHGPALNCPCLCAWTQLTYFLSFSTISVFPLHFAMSRIFYFAQRPKRWWGWGAGCQYCQNDPRTYQYCMGRN